MTTELSGADTAWILSATALLPWVAAGYGLVFGDGGSWMSRLACGSARSQESEGPDLAEHGGKSPNH